MQTDIPFSIMPLMSYRIALISFHTCPLSAEEGKETGGMNVYVLELAKQLIQLGYTIDIFTRRQDKESPTIVVLSPSLRVIHLSAGPTETVDKKQLAQYIPLFVDNFQKFVKEENATYDLLDCHYYLSGLAGLAIQQLYKKRMPLIMTFHTLALMKNLVARDPSEKESQDRIDAELLLVQKSQKIISASPSDCEYLRYLYLCPQEKIAQISPGVNVSLFTTMDKTVAKKHIHADIADTVILFVGRIEPLKGVDVLLYALKMLYEKNNALSVCLWIVGGPSKEKEKLEELRKELHMETFVTFVGRQNPEELPYFYNAAELAVMPSQYESFGMSALEAMACGTPVIITDATGVSDVLDEEHQQLVTSANNPLLLAEQIEYLLTHKEERERLGKEVQKKVQNLDWKHVALRMGNVYESLI